MANTRTEYDTRMLYYIDEQGVKGESQRSGINIWDDTINNRTYLFTVPSLVLVGQSH